MTAPPEAAALIGIDEERVGAWLAANIPGATAPFTYQLITGGHSNLTYRVDDAAGRPMVLRRPPMGRVLATAHDMAREHRIITAVGRTEVPVAPTLGLCTDETVNGAPFYVMGYVDGVVLDSPERAEGIGDDVRAALAWHLVDVLADLHAVDVAEVGLADLARHDGYIERQLRRWSSQWEQSKTRELPAVEEVERALRERLPVQQGVSVVHGDYRLGNCLSDPAAGRIAAVLDWELCTLGDPLADLGYIGVYWTDPGKVALRQDVTAGSGFPPYSALVERYAARTGRDVSQVEYYRAFSCWRLAVIVEGVYSRYLHGVMADADADLERFKTDVERLAETALESVHRLP